MDSFRDKIDTLRNLLQYEDSFGKTASYFFDNLGENRSFLADGKLVKNAFLKKIIRKACDNFISTEAPMSRLLIIHFKEYGFYHGPFFIGASPANFFYYEDLKMGMILIVRSMSTGMMSYLRFRGTVLPGKGLTLAPGSTTIQ